MAPFHERQPLAVTRSVSGVLNVPGNPRLVLSAWSRLLGLASFVFVPMPRLFPNAGDTVRPMVCRTLNAL